ncbi:phosphatidylserine decarboxylase [Cryptococcus bacillisporus CA1280]|uniref:Phosphatidylserine decarboxylase n=2 Tax=Cryptococcus gattii TaxID=552467 RepID=A0A0D0VPT6_CRYGA|nr:phosphatidylserine decarboxylase [Cryptococcus bacillisporus CA1280]KIR60414.1 phosphatidylserine decarboxylase [Cryptococcus bacillisporus CA1873]|eukprot:KIR60414.1 phosphatidylserine decarboxylase [Cryptococcus gattii CA1873]
MDPISDPPTQRSSRPVHVLPEELGKPLEDSLDHIVSNSKAVRGDRKDQLAPSQLRADAVHSHGPEAKHWVESFFSEETLDHLFAMEHMGNYVIDRMTGKKFFETMPIYVRIGMHLLFVSGNSYMSYSSVEKLLREESIKQGQTYDQTGPDVEEHIKSFIKTYDLPLDELLVKDLSQYPTFNSFFSRRLLPTARPITSVGDPTIIVSAADCRLTVYQTVDQAKKFWIKGQQFTLPNLLIGNDVADTRFKAIQEDNAAALAIHRLAPQDYHRFHSPVEGVIGAIKDIDGELYTVNPQAVNENLNVFTMNKRSIMLIHANLGSGRESVPIAFVAIGAMLVGSIGWSKKPGDKVCKGEELGWFQYGGSTSITVFPKSAGIEFDSDLVENSKKQMETLVRVGMEIGKCSTTVK